MKFDLPTRISPPSPRTLRWLAIASAVPFLGVVAAFGIAPDTEVHALGQKTRVEQVAVTANLSAGSAQDSAWDFWVEERIQRGDSVGALASRIGLTSDEANRLATTVRAHSALGRMNPGQSVLARVTQDGQLLLLRHLDSSDRLLTVERSGDNFTVKTEAVRLERRTDMRSGVIESSLFGATDAADIPDSIASEMAEVFSGEIDFHRELQRGDHFSVVYETFYHDGRLVRTGRLLAAEFSNNGKNHQAFAFNDNGRHGYYSAEGKSLKRAFLKSPLPFSRISSGFSSSRFHPVLKEWRAHKGIDYAAPTGTPIRAIADAVVEFSGRQGGYGNLIVLKHGGSYSTAYGHLSRFGKGIKRGARISQGQIIGFVGMTGLASGPHLHYEFRVNGMQKNPLALKLPTSVPLAPRARAAFQAAVTPFVTQLGMVREHNLAAFE